MINGAHVVIFSKDAEADRKFIRDVLGFRSVDDGHGWHIFELPRSEAAVHPASENDRHELYMMCADLSKKIDGLRADGVQCEDLIEERWGFIAKVRLPGRGKIGLYEPKHARTWPRLLHFFCQSYTKKPRTSVTIYDVNFLGLTSGFQ